jgi:hypothetical protein
VALLGLPCDVFVRHYKTDWWVEREPVWLSQAPFADREPLARALALLLAAELDGKIAVLNPFGAIVPQNKRSLALMWEERQRFSPEAQAAIARYLVRVGKFLRGFRQNTQVSWVSSLAERRIVGTEGKKTPADVHFVQIGDRQNPE